MSDVMPQVGTGQATEERACPSCSATNPPGAEFCWRCFSSLQSVGAPMQRTGWAPLPPAPPAPATTRPMWPKILAAVVAALVGFATWAFVTGRFGGGGPELPDSVAGYPKVTSPEIEQGIEEFHGQIDSAGVEGDIAFYGTANIPTFAVIWYHDGSKPDPQMAFEAFAAGFGTTSGSAIDLASMEQDAVDGTTYFCSPIGGGLEAGICMWQDGEVYWFVLDVQPGAGVSGTRELAVKAKASVDGA